MGAGIRETLQKVEETGMKKGTTLFIAIICILAITTVGLYTGYEEKKEQVETLQQDMLIRDDMDGAFSEEIAEKDKQIQGLADVLEEKDRKIQDLKDDVKEMEQQITALTDDAEQYVERINALSEDVSSRDSRIGELEASITEKSGKIGELETIVAGKDSKVGELEAAVAEKDSKISELEAAVSEKDNKSGELEGSVSAAQEQIDSLSTDLADKSKSIETLNADIQNKASQIETLTAEAASTKETIQNLETELKGKEETVVRLETQLTEKEKTIKELNDSIAEKDKTIEGLEVKNQNLQTLLNTFAQNQDQNKESAETNGLASLPPKVTMDFDTNTLSEPGKIHVVITVTNAGEEDMNEPVTLYYPDDKKVEEFGDDGLPAGETRSWTGEWDVTQEQLDEGKVAFIIRYSIYDGEAGADGLPALRQHKTVFSKHIIKGK